jgi:hypothetical protein
MPTGGLLSVNYTDDMALKAALFGIPALAMTLAVLLLNWLDAGPGLAAAVLVAVSAGGGVCFGIFAEHLPEIPRVTGGRRAARAAR